MSHQTTKPRRTSLSNYLFEDAVPLPDPTPQNVVSPDITATTQPQNISLDQKVDAFLIQTERNSTPNAPQIAAQANVPTPTMPESRKSRLFGGGKSFSKLVLEADEPDANNGEDDPASGSSGGTEDPLGGDAGGGLGDLGGGDGGGDAGGGADASKVPPVPVPKLNLNVFAAQVARLVNNYEALLDPRTTILLRAQTYVAKNYTPRMANELMTTLEMNYGLSSKTMQEQPSMQAPPMVGAAVGDLSSSPGSGGTVGG